MAGQRCCGVPAAPMADAARLALAVRGLIRPALDYALPPRCPGCGVITAQDDALPSSVIVNGAKIL